MANTGIDLDARVAGVSVTDEALTVTLRDGRSVSAPLGWFPRLASATADQRVHWETSAVGFGIHWPQIDEDVSVDGLLTTVRLPQVAA